MLRASLLLSVVLSGLLLLSSCATSNFDSRISLLGAYQDTRELEQKAADMRSAEAGDVKVFLGSLPEGTSFENEKIAVDPKRFQVIAKVTSSRVDNPVYPIWFYPYAEDEEWRKGLCYSQVPLTWVTGLLWSFMPTNWPCWVSDHHVAGLDLDGGCSNPTDSGHLGDDRS